MLRTVDKVFEAVGLRHLTRGAKVVTVVAGLAWFVIGSVWFVQGFNETDAQAPFAFVWAAMFFAVTLIVILGIDAAFRRLR